MKYSRYFLFLLLSIGFILSCSDDLELVPQQDLEFKFLLDVSYGTHVEQVFDLYLPANRTFETKVMVLVHGGGWRGGDKQDLEAFKEFVLEQHPDLAIVNLNYRLADDDNPPLPMQINDITSVVDHLKDKQQEYQLGTELGFLGGSAGAHLSLLWSYVHDKNDQVKMVCSIVGPTNLADDAYVNSDNEGLKNLFNQFGETIEELKEVSPLYRATSKSPPTILFYGGKDPLIPNTQGKDLNDRLEELNVEHEYTLYPNAGHGWSGEDLLDTAFKLNAFVEKHFLN